MKLIKRPKELDPELQKEVEAWVKARFRKLVYTPLYKATMNSVKNSVVSNSKKTPLLKAIDAGKVGVQDKVLYVPRGAKYSRELKSYGAKFDKRRGGWRVDYNKLPKEILRAVNKLTGEQISLAKELKNKLDKIDLIKIELPDFIKQLTAKNVKKLEAELDNQIPTIAPKYSVKERKVMEQEYFNNMEKSINGFVEKEVVQLRKLVQKNLEHGHRREVFAEKLMARYDMSEKRAAFIARQESNLLNAKAQEQKFRKVSNKYIWRTLKTNPNVREAHKNLEGTIHTWDNPPITTGPREKVQRRNHPKEDFNCRCHAEIIIE